MSDRGRSARAFGLLAGGLALWSLLGCATAHRPAGARRFAAIGATTADEAWRTLLARRAALESIQAYVRIRATDGVTSQSFRATLSHDSGSRTRVEALTPLGTAAFTLFSDGDKALFIDHLHRKFWRGPASSIGSIAGALVPIVNLADLTLLAIGLPIDETAVTRCDHCAAEGGLVVMQQGDSSYFVGTAGLARAVIQRGNESLTVDYTPAAFPPTTVVISRRGAQSPAPVQRLELQILDLVTDPAAVQSPVVPADYTCCAGS